MAPKISAQASRSSRSTEICFASPNGTHGFRRETAITSHSGFRLNRSSAAAPTTPEAPAIRIFFFRVSIFQPFLDVFIACNATLDTNPKRIQAQQQSSTALRFEKPLHLRGLRQMRQLSAIAANGLPRNIPSLVARQIRNQ